MSHSYARPWGITHCFLRGFLWHTWLYHRSKLRLSTNEFARDGKGRSPMFVHDSDDRDVPVIVALHPMGVTGTDLRDLLSVHLQGTYRLVCPDQGGHGEGGRPYATADAEADQLHRWLKEQGIGRIRLLLAMSLGVACAMRLLQHDDIQVEHVHLDSSPMLDSAPLIRPLFTSAFLRVLHACKADPARAVSRLVGLYGHGFAQTMVGNFMRMSEDDVRRMCTACCTGNLLPLGERMQERTVFEWGSDDFDLRLCRRKVERRYPKARIVVRTGYGHCGYLARNAASYVRELEASIA